MTLTTLVLALVLQEAPADLVSRLSLRGKLLLSEDFGGADVPADWKKSKGEWTIADGALRGKELAADKHSAVIKHALPAKDFILQLSFKLDGAKQATCSFDGKGHVCRVILTPQGFTLRRDVPKDGDEKPQTLAKGAVELKAGDWHRLLIEIRGREFLAQVDDKVVAFGEHDGVALDKTSFGLPVSGESFRVDSVRLWESLPNPDWAAEKAKLAGKP